MLSSLVAIYWFICFVVMTRVLGDQVGTDGDCKSITSGVGVARRLYLVSRRRPQDMKKAGSSGPPHPSFFVGCHASEIRSSAGREPKGSERTSVDLCGQLAVVIGVAATGVDQWAPTWQKEVGWAPEAG